MTRSLKNSDLIRVPGDFLYSLYLWPLIHNVGSIQRIRQCLNQLYRTQFYSTKLDLLEGAWVQSWEYWDVTAGHNNIINVLKPGNRLVKRRWTDSMAVMSWTLMGAIAQLVNNCQSLNVEYRHTFSVLRLTSTHSWLTDPSASEVTTLGRYRSFIIIIIIIIIITCLCGCAVETNCQQITWTAELWRSAVDRV